MALYYYFTTTKKKRSTHIYAQVFIATIWREKNYINDDMLSDCLNVQCKNANLKLRNRYVNLETVLTVWTRVLESSLIILPFFECHFFVNPVVVWNLKIKAMEPIVISNFFLVSLQW